MKYISISYLIVHSDSVVLLYNPFIFNRREDRDGEHLRDLGLICSPVVEALGWETGVVYDEPRDGAV